MAAREELRKTGQYESLGAALPVIHMNDYPAQPLPEEIDDSFRVYPGDGVAPLGEILRTLQATGGRNVLSLELFNHEYWKRDAVTIARTGFETALDDVFPIRPGDDRQCRRARFSGQTTAQFVAVAVREKIIDDRQIVIGFRRHFGGLADRTGGARDIFFQNRTLHEPQRGHADHGGGIRRGDGLPGLQPQVCIRRAEHDTKTDAAQ